MYQKGGVAYVYLCYGIHHLFNIVTNVKGVADAVLIRALEPIEGVEIMKERGGEKPTNGPGKLSKAMGIVSNMTGDVLGEKAISIEKGEIVTSDRKL